MEWNQRCQMAYLDTKNTNLATFLVGLCMQNLSIFYGHLEYFVVIWYIPPAFGMLKQEKSGNPEWNTLLW
jgi:hypothetical protein